MAPPRRRGAAQQARKIRFKLKSTVIYIYTIYKGLTTRGTFKPGSLFAPPPPPPDLGLLWLWHRPPLLVLLVLLVVHDVCMACKRRGMASHELAQVDNVLLGIAPAVRREAAHQYWHLNDVGRCKLDPSLKAPCFQPSKPAYVAFQPDFSSLHP